MGKKQDVSTRTLEGLLTNGVHPSQLDPIPPVQQPPAVNTDELHQRISDNRAAVMQEIAAKEEAERQRIIKSMGQPPSMWEMFLRSLKLQGKQ